MRLAPWLVPLGIALAACPARDRDVDGLVGRSDACPGAAESLNGWRDQDGCPDALARLRVEVTREGAGVAGIQVSLPGAPPQVTGEDGVAVFLELLPSPRGTFVQVVDGPGTLDVAVPLDEGANTVHVELEPAP